MQKTLKKVCRYQMWVYICLIKQTKNNNTMQNLFINPTLISDNNTFNFVHVPSMYKGFYDVMYKGQRIAILNGLSAPLQWTAKNGSNIPIKVVEQLEKMVVRMISKSNNV